MADLSFPLNNGSKIPAIGYGKRTPNSQLFLMTTHTHMSTHTQAHGKPRQAS